MKLNKFLGGISSLSLVGVLLVGVLPCNTVFAASDTKIKVSYTNADDIHLDGANANGKIARLKLYRSSTYPTYIRAASVEGNSLWVNLYFTPNQRNQVKSISTEYSGTMVTFKILAFESGECDGQLISVKGIK